MVRLNGELIGHGTFPNKEAAFKGLDKLIKPLEKNVLTVRYDHHEKTFEAFVMLATILNQTIRNAREKLILEMPYMPYLRADRQVGDDPQMLTVILDVVTHLCGDWKAIKVFDPHVDIARGYLNPINLEVSTPEFLIEQVLCDFEPEFQENAFYLVFPDEGARKRVRQMRRRASRTLEGEKTRDARSGKITSIVLSECSRAWLETAPKENRRAIIVDDIVSYGGTATAIAKQLKEEFGFERVVAWFSHTEPSYYKGKNISQPWIDKVYTTDSILENHDEFTLGETWHDKVTIIPIPRYYSALPREGRI